MEQNQDVKFKAVEYKLLMPFLKRQELDEQLIRFRLTKVVFFRMMINGIIDEDEDLMKFIYRKISNPKMLRKEVRLKTSSSHVSRLPKLTKKERRRAETEKESLDEQEYEWGLSEEDVNDIFDILEDI